MKQRVHVLDLEFDPLKESEVLSQIDQAISSKRRLSFRYVKPYVVFFRSAHRDESIRSAINSADLVIADGVSAQWAASYLADDNHSLWLWLRSIFVSMRNDAWLTRIIPERGAGVDTTHQLLLRAAQNGWRVGVLGGRDPKRIERSLLERYPLLQIGGVWSGYFAPRTESKLLQRIADTKLDLLFVALGHPKQEVFMQVNRQRGLARVLIGEGGTFDYDEMGGSLKRAPQWMRRVGLEWLWRILMRPADIRKSTAIIPFMWRVYLTGRNKKLH